MQSYTIKPDEEFLVLTEKPADTQKKIKQWVSTGYQVTIINQCYGTNTLITTLTRRK
jgi:hypothetical protein